MNRAYIHLINEYLSFFSCVAIVGPRQCGKTTLLGTLPEPWRVFDLEKQADFQTITQDLDLFFRLHGRHVAIDEAQVLPELFQALRVAIDKDRNTPGRFIITGSSSPSLLTSISETLAGRVAVIEMAPLSFSETAGVSVPRIIGMLAERSAKPADLVDELCPFASIDAVHEYWFRGGYPEPWVKNQPRFRKLWMDQYIGTYIYRDVARLFPGLNETNYRRFIQLLSGLSGMMINFSDVARSLGVSQPTVRDYFDIAHGTFVWRKISAYEKNAVKRIVKRPKGYLRDSGLLHYLMRIPDRQALLAHPILGKSWEGMVVEEILRGFSASGIGLDAFHYRTAGGAEVDLIIEGDFGRIAFEIKHSQTISARELRAIKDFTREQDCRFGIVINNDERVRRYDETLIGVPFACFAQAPADDLT